MKKRMLSIAVAAVMLLGSFVNIAYAATPLVESDLYLPEADVYEGNTPLETAEKILDELNNYDGATIEFVLDKEKNVEQLATIQAANVGLASMDEDDFTDALDFLNARMTDEKKQYLAALVKAYSEGNANVQAVLDEFDTTMLSLRDSFGTLTDYISYMQSQPVQDVLTAEGVSYNYDDAKFYIAEPLIAITKILFAQDGTADDVANYTETGKYMRENYIKEFLANDRAKKTLAVLFGAGLTEEIVSDSAAGEDVKGIVRHVKKYFSDDLSRITDLMDDMESVMVANKEDAVNAAFDLLGRYVAASYPAGDLKDDVIMLMGDGTDDHVGLFERLVKAVDPTGTGVSNTWINLFLSEFVQLTLVDEANTISADEPNPTKITIKDNAYVNFAVKNLSRYGINNAYLSNGCFDVVCYVYNEETSSFEESTKVDYVDDKFTVTTDSSKGQYYDAYLMLYRSGVSNTTDTFIESYPVEIRNYTPSGGGGVSRYTISYETNGGTQLSNETHAKGKVVELTKVPTKEGYIFAGWYIDKELTQKVTSLVMDKSIKLYAAWTKDGSTVVSNVPVPEILNGEDHYAYIMGYPDGTILPQGNITRAETATIIFRLLKDEIRDKNITEENVFTDVNEGEWYNTAVSTLAALGIVQGRTQTEFMPNEKITRAEFSVIMARIADFSHEASHEFKDVSSHWAEDYIYEAAAYGWIAGYEDATFRPDQFITRAEAMTLTNRVLRRVPENKDALLDGMTEWSDNKDTNAWYYIAVQEATNSHKYERKNETFEIWTELMDAKDWTQYE